MDIKILVADDDHLFLDLVCDIIKKQGYIAIKAENGGRAIDIFFSSNDIDLVILDVMMPVFDGWDVLKEIRQHSDVPVIMLTALGDQTNEINGLNNGADEYIAKPFSYELFVARLEAILRKVKKQRSALISIGSITIEQQTQKVRIDGNLIDLNRKEYQLLIYFIKNKNRVLTREQILNSIWGYDFDGDIRTIDTHIKTLRAKLSGSTDYIKTIRGSGYMFEEPKP